MHDAFVHNEDPSVVAILAGLKLVLALLSHGIKRSTNRTEILVFIVVLAFHTCV